MARNGNPALDLRMAATIGRRSAAARESDWIGRKLNQVYSQTLAEPLPPEFMALIEAIGAQERDDESAKP